MSGRVRSRWLRGGLVAAVLVGALTVPWQAGAGTEPAALAASPSVEPPAGGVATTSKPVTAEATSTEESSEPAPWPEGRTAEASAAAEPGTAAASSPIADKHAALGGDAGVLGQATGPEECTLSLGGCFQLFTNGEIVWSYVTGAHALTDADIYLEWADQGLEDGPLGYPTSDTFCGLRDGGCGQHFQDGSIYWSAAAGAFVMAGPVRDRWAAQGWENGALRYPVSQRFCSLRDSGCGQHFQGGSIYQSSSGAFDVLGPLRDRWAAQGWENGRLGYPTSATFCGLRDGGCGQHFQGGSIYWSPATGARVLIAPVSNRWAAQGWERGALGYPTSEVFCGLKYRACGQHFAGGSIYSYSTGTFVVAAAIRDRWAALGWEHGYLGFPTSEVFCGLRDGGCGQHFEGGSIYSSPHGTFGVPRATTLTWAELGWENGMVGYPKSDVFCGLRNGGCGQHFTGGSMYRDRTVIGYEALRPIFVPDFFRNYWATQGWENGRLGYPASRAHDQLGHWIQTFNGGYLTLKNGRVSVTWHR